MKLVLLAILLCLLQNAFSQESKKDTTVLKEAIIRAKKPLIQQRPEGIVVNVESSLLTRGSSALEVLERSPGIIIDRRNNNISLNGKDGVMVMFNGKLMRMSMTQVMTLLQGMSANDIEKIELLTTPPAKYDAEGSAGLINIVLKKNQRPGTYGNLSLTGGYGWREKATASVNLAHNTRRVDVYGTYTFSHDKGRTSLYIPGTNDFPVLGGPLEVLFLDTTRIVQNNHHITAGGEIRVNARTTVGTSLIYGANSTDYYAINNATYNVLPDSVLSFRGNVHTGARWQNLVSSVWLERKIRESEKMTFDIDYLRWHNNNPSTVQSTFTNKHGAQAGTNNDSLFSPRQRGMARTTINVGVIKLDYEKQWNKKIRLEAGAKGTYTRSVSISGLESVVDGEWVARTETSNDVVMEEGIGAVYTSVHSKLDSATDVTIGLRYEYAHTQLPGIDRRLGTLFPQISFSRKITEKAELQLSYSRRISRPTYNDLASFVGYVDPVAVFTGNPLLKPTITSNIKLGYTIGAYSFSLVASRDDHPIAGSQLTESPAHDLLYVSPQNLVYRNELTFQANLPWQINEWWNMSYSLTGGWRRFKETYTAMPAEKAYFSGSFNFNQTFRLPGNFSVELSGWYNSPTWWGTIKAEGFGAFNAGVKKELKNDAGSFQLSIADVLRTTQIRMHFGSLTREAFATTSHVQFNPESRTFPIIKLTYSRAFGSAGKTQRKQGNGSQDASREERDRIRKN